MNNFVWQWSSKSIGTNQLLHPTFTHGTTLGLYEVLTEKPCICDIITNSVVLCFFIETEKIFSALRSDPAVEDFFWRVCIGVIFLIPCLAYKFQLSRPSFCFLQ